MGALQDVYTFVASAYGEMHHIHSIPASGTVWAPRDRGASRVADGHLLTLPLVFVYRVTRTLHILVV